MMWIGKGGGRGEVDVGVEKGEGWWDFGYRGGGVGGKIRHTHFKKFQLNGIDGQYDDMGIR